MSNLVNLIPKNQILCLNGDHWEIRHWDSSVVYHIADSDESISLFLKRVYCDRILSSLKMLNQQGEFDSDNAEELNKDVEELRNLLIALQK